MAIYVADVCAAALVHFGERNQILKTIEELAELQRALSRYLVAVDQQSATLTEELQVVEELADVEIMTTQMALAFRSFPMSDMLDKKISRLADRLGMTSEPKSGAL